MNELKTFIRDIPDFPKKGIIFKDITTLLKDGKRFKQAVDTFAREYKDKKIDLIVSVEARGFIFGAALAYKLGAGIIPVRKKGKLPFKTYAVSYDLEYGKDTLEIHQDAISKGDNVLIVDDLLATGGTSRAVIDLIEKIGGKVVGLAFLIELLPLKGREKLKDYNIVSLIKDEYC
ncbi:MAG: adenine phosphoribosyltransferase [Candidatus Omnitrophica bacterium]|nr:adenine phosphoribosyltransferase [Candidatus Omnitrophota bacterium]MCM8790156.1 adenine phosphoribosyltransferase [Candidatus Omnitrophota bacterium]